MTLEELKKRCEKAGFKYAFGKFEKATEPPHLVAITAETNNFFADNKVYSKDMPIQLDYTYITKNIDKFIVENGELVIVPQTISNKYRIKY